MAVITNNNTLKLCKFRGINLNRIFFNSQLVASTPTITGQPIGGSIFETEAHPMIVYADGHGVGLVYQWYKNGVKIVGATSREYIYGPNGDTTNYQFYCMCIGFGTQTKSATVTISVSFSFTHVMRVGAATYRYGYHYQVGSTNYGTIDTTAISGTSQTVCGVTANYSSQTYYTIIYLLPYSTSNPNSYIKMRLDIGTYYLYFFQTAYDSGYRLAVDSNDSKNVYDYMKANNGKDVRMTLQWYRS